MGLDPHRSTNQAGIDWLARQLLGTSLDLPLVAKDLKQTWSYWPGEIRLIGESDLTPKRSRNALNAWGEDLNKSLDELIAMDETYRDVLSTAASLTGASQNMRIARWTLIIAFVTLIVAVVTLVVAGCAAPSPSP